jgi:ribosome biogenesis GTPase
LTLQALGWTHFHALQFGETQRDGQVPARVIEEQRGGYRVMAEAGEWHAVAAGALRYHAAGGGLPAVGDWVALRAPEPSSPAVIEEVLERRTSFSRKVAGARSAEQVIAANIDTVFVVTSLNLDLNLPRLERYLTLVWESGAEPVILLSKADLCAEPAPLVAQVEAVAREVPVHAVSAVAAGGLLALQEYLVPGRTTALVGSSGVGKSTIINRLAGREMLAVSEIRAHDDRGRHTTTARRLIVLPGGGMVIDTPGIRELQLWDGQQGLSQAFEDIGDLAGQCRFRDCRHLTEPGCAVRAAVQEGSLDERRLESFHKLGRELRYQELRQDVAAAAAERKKWRAAHKWHARHDKRK